MQNSTNVDTDFILKQNNSQLAIIAADMAEEYRNINVLTELTALDSDDFV